MPDFDQEQPINLNPEPSIQENEARTEAPLASATTGDADINRTNPLTPNSNIDFLNLEFAKQLASHIAQLLDSEENLPRRFSGNRSNFTDSSPTNVQNSIRPLDNLGIGSSPVNDNTNRTEPVKTPNYAIQSTVQENISANFAEHAFGNRTSDQLHIDNEPNTTELQNQMAELKSSIESLSTLWQEFLARYETDYNKLQEQQQVLISLFENFNPSNLEFVR